MIYTMYIPSFVQFWGGHFQTFVELIWNDPILYSMTCMLHSINYRSHNFYFCSNQLDLVMMNNYVKVELFIIIMSSYH